MCEAPCSKVSRTNSYSRVTREAPTMANPTKPVAWLPRSNTDASAEPVMDRVPMRMVNDLSAQGLAAMLWADTSPYAICK